MNYQIFAGMTAPGGPVPVDRNRDEVRVTRRALSPTPDSRLPRGYAATDSALAIMVVLYKPPGAIPDDHGEFNGYGLVPVLHRLTMRFGHSG